MGNLHDLSFGAIELQFHVHLEGVPKREGECAAPD
jgi:hypothetical protein